MSPLISKVIDGSRPTLQVFLLDFDLNRDAYRAIKLRYKGGGMETIIPLSELQNQAKKIVERVKNTHNTVIITQRGRPAALLVSYEDYGEMVATLEEMSQPGWRVRLAETERDSRAGKGIEREEFQPRRATCGTMRLNCSHGRKKS